MFDPLISYQLDPFLNEQEKQTLINTKLKMLELNAIIHVLQDDLTKQKTLYRIESEKWSSLYKKAKLLMHANCDHKWSIQEIGEIYRTHMYDCPMYDWCKHTYSHTHEKCVKCGLVKGESCYK